MYPYLTFIYLFIYSVIYIFYLFSAYMGGSLLMYLFLSVEIYGDIL